MFNVNERGAKEAGGEARLGLWRSNGANLLRRDINDRSSQVDFSVVLNAGEDEENACKSIWIGWRERERGRERKDEVLGSASFSTRGFANPAYRLLLASRNLSRRNMRLRVESEMKKGKSGRIVFSGYLDTDGARTGGQAGRAREGGHSRPPERRSTREEGNHYWRRCCFDNTFCKGRERERESLRPTDRLNDGRTALTLRRWRRQK